ncbi:hypothetical protein D3C84_1114780 [compost metagenome]
MALAAGRAEVDDQPGPARGNGLGQGDGGIDLADAGEHGVEASEYIAGLGFEGEDKQRVVQGNVGELLDQHHGAGGSEWLRKARPFSANPG